jgi:hypothetical protein
LQPLPATSSGFIAHTALVHAEPPDLQELIHELSERTATGYLFGGLSSASYGTYGGWRIHWRFVRGGFRPKSA